MENTKICPPSRDWLYFPNLNNEKILGGHIWLNKNRSGKKINSVTLVEDKEKLITNWPSYLDFAKSQFEKRKFIIEKINKINKSLSWMKIFTEDKSIYFYQAYFKKNSRVWTISCAGPNLKIIDKDCMEFFKSIN